MDSPRNPIRTCPRTGIRYRCVQPGEGPARGALFFLNGIGLDLEGFQEALQFLCRPLTLANHPYPCHHHVALTVPGFEDEVDRLRGASLLSMGEQAALLADFMSAYLEREGLGEALIYGFSFGSDLAVELLERLPEDFPLALVILAEINVHAASCFISHRIAESYEAATATDHGRHKEAYSGFVSRILRAHMEGRIGGRLMQDMSVYFHTIARKDWHQLALSAREACADPEGRVGRLLEFAARRPALPIEVILSDLADLHAFQRRIRERGDCGALRVLDSTRNDHFHHMGHWGVAENLGGRVPEAAPLGRGN